MKEIDRICISTVEMFAHCNTNACQYMYLYVAEYFRWAYAKVAFIVQHMYFKCNDIVFYPYYPNLPIF